MSFIDYTPVVEKGSYFGFPKEGLIAAHARGKQFLLLRSISEPVKRFDGKIGRYEVFDAVLSVEAVSPGDEAFVCVKCSEYIYLTSHEAAQVKKALKIGECLVDQFIGV